MINLSFSFFFFFKSVGYHLRTLVKILVAGYIFNSPQSPKWSQLTWGTPLGELAPPSDQRNIFLWISIFLCLLFFVITSVRHFFLTWKEYTISTGSIQNHKIKITPNKMTPKALWIVLYIKPNWSKMFEHVFWRGDESIFLTFDLVFWICCKIKSERDSWTINHQSLGITRSTTSTFLGVRINVFFF